MPNTFAVRTWDLMLPRLSRVLVTNPDRQLLCHFSKTVLRIPSTARIILFQCIKERVIEIDFAKFTKIKLSGHNKSSLSFSFSNITLIVLSINAISSSVNSYFLYSFWPRPNFLEILNRFLSPDLIFTFQQRLLLQTI